MGRASVGLGKRSRPACAESAGFLKQGDVGTEVPRAFLLKVCGTGVASEPAGGLPTLVAALAALLVALRRGRR